MFFEYGYKLKKHMHNIRLLQGGDRNPSSPAVPLRGPGEDNVFRTRFNKN